MERTVCVPPKYINYLDFYYLRDFDLFPERVRDCPYNTDFIEGLLEQGMLFSTKEEALAVREIIINAYKDFLNKK